MSNQPFDVSWWSIIKVALVVLALWALWQVRAVLVLGLIVVVIVAALAPVVDRWSARISRTLAVSLIYLAVGVVIALLGSLVIPPLVSEIEQLATSLPMLVDRSSNLIGSTFGQETQLSQQLLDSIAGWLQGIGSALLATTSAVIGGLVGVVTVLIISFYLLLEEHGGRKLIVNMLPMENREKVAAILHKIGHKMGAWLRGQLTLAVIIGVLSFIILALVGVPYSLTLAVWAGVTELIPFIGPVLGAIPAVILAFTVAPVKGFIVLVAYVLVQQLEANILVPKVMGKAVGLSPVVIIFAILIGAQLAGFLGVVLAVPAAAAISVLVQEWPQLRRKI